MQIYTEILLKPIFNLLVLIYNLVPAHDLGITIVLLTLVIKLILYPLNRKSIISQKALQKVQPQMDELKEKYKGEREKLGTAMMELYKKEKINPLSSCLPLLLQLPILIAVYQVFQQGLNGNTLNLLYPWVANPGPLKTIAFGFFDLTQNSIVLAVMAGAAQYWQTKMLMNRNQKKGSTAAAMNMQMLYLMPIFTIFIGSRFPAGLTLYWFSTTLFSGLQQLWMLRRTKEQVV